MSASVGWVQCREGGGGGGGVGQASHVSIIAESAQGRHAETCTFFH